MWDRRFIRLLQRTPKPQLTPSASHTLPAVQPAASQPSAFPALPAVQPTAAPPGAFPALPAVQPAAAQSHTSPGQRPALSTAAQPAALPTAAQTAAQLPIPPAMTHLGGNQSTSASTSGSLSMPRSSQPHMPRALSRLQPFNQPGRKEFVPLTRPSRGGGGRGGEEGDVE